jgi:hypothetical protein
MASAAPVPDAFAPPVQPALGPVQRVVDTFVAPTRAFTDLTRSTSWWLPFLLFVLSSLAFAFTIQKQVGWNKTYDSIIAQSPKQQEQFANMPPAQAAPAKALGAKITQGFAYGAPVLILLVAAIAAAVLMGTLNFGFGGTAKFGQLFALYMYAALPLLLKTVLAIVALFAGLSGDSFNIQNPVGTNLGYYLGTESPKWLIALGTSLDLFVLWQIALLVIGCAILAKISRGMAAVAVIGWWALFLVLKVAGAAISG